MEDYLRWRFANNCKSEKYRHEKRCDPVILDHGQILGEMWTFWSKTTCHIDKPRIWGFCPENIHKSNNLWLIWLYFYLWIGSELSTTIYNVLYIYNITHVYCAEMWTIFLNQNRIVDNFCFF